MVDSLAPPAYLLLPKQESCSINCINGIYWVNQWEGIIHWHAHELISVILSHFSGLNEWCFNCHLDTNHINCHGPGNINIQLWNNEFSAWNKFPIFCFHKGTGTIYHEEQSLGHQSLKHRQQCWTMFILTLGHWAPWHPGSPLPPPTHIGVSQRVKTTPSSRQYTGCCRTHAKADLSFSVVSSGATGVGLRQGLRTAWKMLSWDQTWSLALGRIMFPLLNVLQYGSEVWPPPLYNNTNNTAITNYPWVPHGEIIGNVLLNSFSPHDSFRYTK